MNLKIGQHVYAPPPLYAPRASSGMQVRNATVTGLKFGSIDRRITLTFAVDGRAVTQRYRAHEAAKLIDIGDWPVGKAFQTVHTVNK